MKDGHFPAGPRLPSAIQSAWLAYRPHRFLEGCRDRFGDAFSIRTPLGRTPIFAHPEYVERIFELDGNELAGGAAQSRLFQFAGDRSLMKLDGPDHRACRGELARALNPAAMPSMGDMVLDRVRDEVATWPRGERFDLGSRLDRLALELVAQICLGGATDSILESTRRGMKLLARASTPTGIALAAIGLGKAPGFVRDARGLIEGHLRQQIAAAGQATPQPSRCIFHRLMNQGKPGRVKLGPQEVEDNVMTVMAAMLGGLSCSMKHSFAWVLRSRGVAERIRDAVRGAVAGSDTKKIDDHPYLASVCKEILRLSPDIAFAVRQTMTDVEIGGWKLPRGTTLGIGIHLIHQRAESFPEPDRFVADRFIESSPTRFEYLPFGGGRRGCVASSLFPHLQKLILAGVLGQVRLKLLDLREGPVTSFSIVSTPARNLWAIAEPEKSSGIPAPNLSKLLSEERTVDLCGAPRSRS